MSKFPISPSFHWLSLLFTVSTLYLCFDMKDVFCSSKSLLTITASITVMSCSDLNVKLFTSIFISPVKDLRLDPVGNKNSDFL